MNEAVIKYYRMLLKQDFPNSGELERPSVFVEAVGEKLINCGNTGNYMQLYFQVMEDRIVDIKYLCACEPAANVAVEVMCDLVRGMTLQDAADLGEEAFYQMVGTSDESLGKKVRGILELLKEGLESILASGGAQSPAVKRTDDQAGKISWDGTLST